MRRVTQRVDGAFELRRHRMRACEQVVAAIQVERRDGRGRRCGMRRIRVAMRQFDRARRAAVDDRVVDRAARRDCAHRNRGVVDGLRHRQQIRRDAEIFARGRLAEAAETRDYFVENQQDAVLRTDLAQLLQVALRRNQHARRTGGRLDDHRGDRRRVVQRDQAFEFFGEMRAPRRLSLRKCVVFEVVRVRQMIDGGQQRARERLAVRRDAAHRNAAEAHAVVAALASDQPRALAFAARAMIRERDFQRGVHRFGTGVREENPVEPFRHQIRHLRRRFERERVAHLEGRREVERRNLLRDRGDDFVAAVARIHAPEAGAAVQHFTSVRRAVIHALRRFQQARRGLELAVGGERHPERRHVVDDGAGSHGFLLEVVAKL